MDVTWNKEGAALFKKGDYSNAVEYFSKAILNDPVNGVYLVNRSAAFAACDRPEEALQDADNAIRLTPQYSRAYLRKGNALILLQRFEEALIAIEEGLRLDPQSTELLTARTRAKTHLQVSSSNINPYTTSVITIPSPSTSERSVQSPQYLQSTPPMYPRLSTSPSQQRNPLPTTPPITVEKTTPQMLAQSLPSPSKETTSEPTLKKFGLSSWFGLASSSSNSANKRGVDLLQKKQPEEALVELNNAVEGAPTNHQFICNRASALLELSRIEEALLDLNRAIELAPGFLLAHIRKAQALLLQNKIVEARNVLGKAESLASSKKDHELIRSTYSELQSRETYFSVLLPPPDEEPPPYPEGSHIQSEYSKEPLTANSDVESEIVSPLTSDGEDERDPSGHRKRFNRLVNKSSAWLFGALGEEKSLFSVVDEHNEPIELEGFLDFEMQNNRFVKLIQEYLENGYLSFSEEDGMLLHKRPLFDPNSLSSGDSQLVLMLPQNISLENCTLNEPFFLSHFVITSTAVTPIFKPEPFLKEENSLECVVEDVNQNTAVSFFSLNQIMGEVNLKEEYVKVQKNPHVEENKEIASQILREAYVRLGEYFPVKLLLISDPIWIPPPEELLLERNESKKEEKEQLTIDQRFRKLYNSHQANYIRNSVNKFIKNVKKAHKKDSISPSQIALELNAFMKTVDDNVKNNAWASAPKQDLVYAHENIRKHILMQTIDIVFYSLCPEKDEAIRETINRLWFVLPEQLGIDSEAMDDSMYYSAQQELHAINAFLSPREKIECLLNCCRIINFQINREGGFASADDFLPALILVLLNANPHRMWSNIEYMKLFCEKTDELSEAFYFLTMLESAVLFITDINAEHLRMPDQQFQDYFSGAIPHHKPLHRDLFKTKPTFSPTFFDRDPSTITANEIPKLLQEYKFLVKHYPFSFQ